MYSVITVDLSNATPASGTELVKAGQFIAELVILNVPTGTSLELALGPTADFFMVQNPFTMEPDSDDLGNVGLRFRNLVAQAGVKVQLLLVFGKAKLSANLL